MIRAVRRFVYKMPLLSVRVDCVPVMCVSVLEM